MLLLKAVKEMAASLLTNRVLVLDSLCSCLETFETS